MGSDLSSGDLAEEVASLRALTARLRAENARLLRLLELTPEQAAQAASGADRDLRCPAGRG